MRLILSMVLVLCVVVATSALWAAPRAALVMDARTGEVLLAENADTPLHPASLTKMMTLYVVFEALERGVISPDARIVVSANAAGESGSRLGLRAGQRISVRHLVRAVAVASANDAATALAEGVAGSEAAFVARMNATAAAMGLRATLFANAHGLTTEGHRTTARDMTMLGRRLYFDFAAYWPLFSRREADAGLRRVVHTNRRFLGAYQGADGIKTGYTRAAGFTLTASARRGDKHLLVTVFGASSSAERAAWVARLMDEGFARVPTRVAIIPPGRLRPGLLPEKPDQRAPPPPLMMATRPLWEAHPQAPHVITTATPVFVPIAPPDGDVSGLRGRPALGGTGLAALRGAELRPP